MYFLRSSSYEEFIEWYLRRQWRKEPRYPVAATPALRERQMRTWHDGKLRPWFPGAEWKLVRLDSLDELERLIFLEDEETIAQRLVVRDGTENYRLLRRVACNAHAVDYLQSAGHPTIARYAAALAAHFRLEGASRLVICTPDEGERADNPEGTYYLHDGAARALAYMLLLAQETVSFEPVEALLGCRPGNAPENGLSAH